MQIDQNAPAKASDSIAINAPIERVWGLITRVEQWPAWNGLVSGVKIRGSFMPNASFVWKSGGLTITSTIRVVEPNSLIVWTGKTFGTQAIHIWRFKQDGTAVTVETEESFDGWLPRFLPKMMQKTLADALAKWLHALKHQAENKV